MNREDINISKMFEDANTFVGLFGHNIMVKDLRLLASEVLFLRDENARLKYTMMRAQDFINKRSSK